MNTQQIKDLILSMPFSEEDKDRLLDDIKNNLPTKIIMEKVGVLINKKEKSLNQSNPEPAKAYDEINKEYNEDVKKATDQFDQKMDAIENEADQVNKDLSKQLDQIRVEELKESIQG